MRFCLHVKWFSIFPVWLRFACRKWDLTNGQKHGQMGFSAHKKYKCISRHDQSEKLKKKFPKSLFLSNLSKLLNNSKCPFQLLLWAGFVVRKSGRGSFPGFEKRPNISLWAQEKGKYGNKLAFKDLKSTSRIQKKASRRQRAEKKWTTQKGAATRTHYITFLSLGQFFSDPN